MPSPLPKIATNPHVVTLALTLNVLLATTTIPLVPHVENVPTVIGWDTSPTFVAYPRTNKSQPFHPILTLTQVAKPKLPLVELVTTVAIPTISPTSAQSAPTTSNFRSSNKPNQLKEELLFSPQLRLKVQMTSLLVRFL